MGTITAANAIVFLTIPGVFSSPQRIQGFMPDAAFEVPDVDVAETVIGVDGVMSAGFVYFITPWTFSLQADSPSSFIFETWLAAQKANQATFPASGSTSLPAIGRKYAMTNGVLKRMPQVSAARRVLQGRNFVVDWQDVSPASF